jgi:hypothetical protein
LQRSLFEPANSLIKNSLYSYQNFLLILFHWLQKLWTRWMNHLPFHHLTNTKQRLLTYLPSPNYHSDHRIYLKVFYLRCLLNCCAAETTPKNLLHQPKNCQPYFAGGSHCHSIALPTASTTLSWRVRRFLGVRNHIASL